MDTFCRSSDKIYLIKDFEKKQELKKTQNFKHKLLGFSPFIVEITIKYDRIDGKTAAGNEA